jgi:endonuclease/exonuclease/phosphatase family metal-dependent hydrolase
VTVIVLRLGVVGCALVLALTGCGRSSAADAAHGGSTYTLVQMNLCLSGLADCYAKVAYPAALQEAAALIRQAHPDAVTFSEACRNDVARIARRTGYRFRFRFSPVIYRGTPFDCVDPGARGLFGDALLTRAPIVASDNHDFVTQAGIERRRWLCVTTRVRVDVCTAHLNTRDAMEVAGNDGQCKQLATILAHRPAARAVIFGGDVNRRASCAPAGFWTRTDASATQSAGLQQVYGSGALRAPSARVLPFAHSDHDALLVRARLER